MKLNSNFITHRTEEEHMLISTGGKDFSGLIRSNETAAFIIDLLQSEISKAEIIEAMMKRYEAPKEVLQQGVEKALSTLRSIGALDE